MSKFRHLGSLAGFALLAFGITHIAVGAAEMEAGTTLILPDETSVVSGEAVPATRQYDIVEPEYIHALTTFETGINDLNPVWAPTGKLLAFERSRGDKREIVISNTEGKLVQAIYFQLSGAEKESKETQYFLPGLAEDPSYNSGVSWARDSTDRWGQTRLILVFSSLRGNKNINF